MKTPLFQKQSISENLMVYIKDQILSGELNPGDRIVETKLAREVGISQTPVREALRQLQGEGIITIIPNKGPIVSPLDMKAVFEVYSLRSMLEGLAIRLAAQQASDEEIEALESFYHQMKTKLNDETVQFLLQDSFRIHEMIMEMSQHSRLIRMYKSISFQIALVNRMVGTKFSKQKEIDQHWELIDVLKQKDPDLAEKTMRKHIHRSYQEFVEVLKESRQDEMNFREDIMF